MRIAIASTGNNLESNIGQQFGRCSFFVIYDTEIKSIEFLPNPYKDQEEAAGQAAVQLLASRNIHKILSGDFGIKIKPMLDSMKIQMIVLKDSNKRIKDIIEMLNR
jgi:predicted Fe-Mo cluster-binding NifX family protein